MAKKKQNLDMSKEDMYRKIMPSIQTAANDVDDDELIRIAGRDTEHRDINLPYNVMELIVRAKISNVMSRLGACECEQCRNDSIALALNKLPSIYSGSDRESISEKINLIRRDYEIKVTSSVIQAVQTVMQSPRHFKG